MIEIDITEKQVERAEKLYDFKNLKNSITEGKSNIYGAMGEIIVFDYFCDKCKILHESTFDYDMIIDDIKVDVKSKKVTSYPKENYVCSVAAANISQLCDYYLFTRIMKDFSKGFILGYLKKDEFYKIAFFGKKGELDETDQYRKWTFSADCYNVKISELKKIAGELKCQ